MCHSSRSPRAWREAPDFTGLLRGARCAVALAACSHAAAGPPDAEASATAPAPQEVTIVAQRLQLLGTASTASEGVVDDEELQLTPQYRPGQLLETVPGLIVTMHSGEGKASQYLLRGYDLDHGTDLATFVDSMPVNQPTHAHGQGYTDLNFVIPELADGLAYTKGTYYAGIGDFGAVGSVKMDYRDAIPGQVAVTGGSFGFERVFAADSKPVGAGELLAASEYQRYDGPFVTPDDARKENLVLRYSQGGKEQGYSVTGMFYHQDWTNTTDIPLRAITEGLVPSRFGSLDPTDGGHARRYSLSVRYRTPWGDGQLSTSAFFIDNELHLFNDFTHDLVDPVHGDQEEQFESRRAFGGAIDYAVPAFVARTENDIAAGGQWRDDNLTVGRLPSESQKPMPDADDPPSDTNLDHVHLLSLAAYLEDTTHWTPALRSVLGVRVDFQHGEDVDEMAALHEAAGYSNAGSASKTLVQPKASVVYAPHDDVELYVAAGEGFHSADLRGVNQGRSADPGLPRTPLLARQVGEEIGVRAAESKNLAFTVALYTLWQQSETVLDPDVGQDAAGPPSRRSGYEVNLTYQPRGWLEFYASYSGNRARFTRPFDDGTGHVGERIANAPVATGSLAVHLKNLGRWSGGLQYRYLGSYPLSSGPCADSAAAKDFPGVATSCANAPTAPGQVNAKGFGQLNLDARYAFESGWNLGLGIYNLADTKASAAEFWYVDRLRSETANSPDGRADVHLHPLEPRMIRVTLSISM